MIQATDIRDFCTAQIQSVDATEGTDIRDKGAPTQIQGMHIGEGTDIRQKVAMAQIQVMDASAAKGTYIRDTSSAQF